MSLHCNGEELVARAELKLAEGRLADARALFIDAAAVFQQSGDIRREAEARVRAGELEGLLAGLQARG